MPFLAESDVGRLVLMAGIVYAGEAEAGERALKPFRALASPLADLVQAGTYTGMFPPEEGEPFHPKSTSKTLFLDAVDLGSAETIVHRLEESDAAVRAVQIRVLGGAMSRVPGRRDGVRPPLLPDHGERRSLLRGARGPAAARSVGRRPRRVPSSPRGGRLRQLPHVDR